MSKSYKRGQAQCSAPHCGRPTPRQQFVCKGCVEALERDLAGVPALIDELHTTLARLDSLAPGGQLGDNGALLHKPRAGEAMWVLNNAITTWTRLFAEHYKVRTNEVFARAAAGVTAPTWITSAAAKWLLRRVRSVAMHPAAGEAVDEIGSAVELAYAVIDRPPDLLPAGQCGYLGCPAILYAEPDARMITCRVCGSDHEADVRRGWMLESSEEQRLTATAALLWVKLLEGKRIPSGTWRSWLSRGRIAHVDVDHVGHRLYRFGDVRDLAREWERNKQEFAPKPRPASPPPHPPRPNSASGDQHPMWKAGSAGYHAVHKRLRTSRGQAKECEHCGSTEEHASYDWALNWEVAPEVVVDVKGRMFSTDLAAYIRLCRPCHRAFDAGRPGVSA